MSDYVFTVTSPKGFEATVQAATEALKHEGFGVLTTIDVAATLKAKLGIEERPYLILGACNPHYAHQALQAEPDIGALLPCNVVVREEADGGVSVVFMDPAAVLGMVKRPEVDKLGGEVRDKLKRVAEALRA
ncbi:MAG TPA: DUF302 domain-containing protein [Thiomonas arsenitoxydans]|jgi:uncharacterized protein (DUF302 family)|uniref:Uncharacterized conserved protein, DUF302 family n=1 Tax=Thiomonas bhubaneswarensis TaxID=339866 RepID=A0A0K6ICE3_9BURK|nr:MULTISPECIES: DUF302 domain-containing protein [Thiomonas]OYV28389.1 MAG: hypothetical protein B7Z79_13035 [Thiomonas sp. 20-64-9]OZB54368.1 MAG: hypothetical protein B7X43_03465 [Thiomonas sp. 15-63-373]OZB70984.1 MAG: hypothetical protein B7X36_12955 [Thiomonas sp. 14-64-326]OZB68910.1 MAG: hypothetical protein B7X30_14905 [Thiomonas sp. 13-64-67]CUB00794.1 Uncharacterized conserved protein, DUF302 family [Thiomonas bhubaneswarensis]